MGGQIGQQATGIGGMQLPPVSAPTFLDNPVLQGALATYLGAIGTPRSEGLGAAISRGGMMGLQAYSQARQSQYTPYLIQAQLQNLQQKTREAGATADWRTQQAQQIQALKTENQQHGQTLDAIGDSYIKQGKPEVGQMFKNLAPLVAQSDQKQDINKLISDPFTAYRDMTQAGQAVATTRAVETKTPVEVQKMQADIDKDRKEISKMTDEQLKLRAETTENKLKADLDRLKAAEAPAERAQHLAAIDKDLAQQFVLKSGKIYSSLGTADFQRKMDDFIATEKFKMGITSSGAAISDRHKAEAQKYGLTIHPDGTATDAEGNVFDPKPGGGYIEP
jgi:hypothetical protein